MRLVAAIRSTRRPRKWRVSAHDCARRRRESPDGGRDALASWPGGAMGGRAGSKLREGFAAPEIEGNHGGQIQWPEQPARFSDFMGCTGTRHPQVASQRMPHGTASVLDRLARLARRERTPNCLTARSCWDKLDPVSSGKIRQDHCPVRVSGSGQFHFWPRPLQATAWFLRAMGWWAQRDVGIAWNSDFVGCSALTHWLTG